MSGSDHCKVDFYTFSENDKQLGGYFVARVRAGRKKVKRVVPPAGEDYAFDREDWPVDVEITVSPTGRGVQVHVNGERVN